MYNVCEIRLWSTPPAKFNLYIFSCVTFCRKMHFYMHRQRETHREKDRERESLAQLVYDFMSNTWRSGRHCRQIRFGAWHGVQRPGKSCWNLYKWNSLAGHASIWHCKLFDLQCVDGHKNACIETERERENAGKAKREWSKEHSPTMLPRLSSSAFACLKAPEVQFMLYFISPKGRFNFSNFYVDCSPKVLSEYAQFCSVYKCLVLAIRNLP